jgi:DNA-binding response OmpR family regulator
MTAKPLLVATDRRHPRLEHRRLDHGAPTGKHILIVDDSVEYLNFMQLLLGAEGFRAEIAPSTAVMQECLERSSPDLIISDVRMPGNGAFAVLDILRANERTRSIPVLLCTGAVQEVEEEAERLEREGIEVLFKPFDIEVLLERVCRLCDRESLTQG